MKPTVLAVDDEPEILRLIATALEGEGYRVSTALSAEDFRLKNRTGTPDLYLVDISLPDGNGFSLVKELRRESDRGIIILSGRADETDHVVGLEIGADDYVTKPFRLRELCSRVNAVYRRSGRRSPQAAPEPAADSAGYEFDGYRLSLAGRNLRSPGGEEVPLTTAEFDLLAVLLERRKQVLTREDLIRAMKGRDWECHERTVDGLISRLRRKIGGDAGGQRFIRTVHGVGYSFTR